MTQPGDSSSKNRAKAATVSDIRFAPGEILAGKYEVVSFIGSGGMSQVFHVKQIFLSKSLALKVLDLPGSLNEIQVRRFQVEAKAVFALNHVNLVRVYDFGVLDSDEHYLAMDLIEGPTLSEYVKANGPMKPETALPLFLQICSGLSYAHQHGIVHRDLKPNNIMLDYGASGSHQPVPRIVDFGIAKVMSAEGGEMQALTKTGEIFGSPLYMSPEQCSGEVVDYRSDIYSLGCTFFEVLTGTPPHVGANALRTMMLHQATKAPLLREASLGGNFSDGLEHVLQRMLAKSPSDRYQNMTEVVNDLSDAGTGRIKIPAQVRSSESPAPASISKLQTSIISAIAILVISGGVLLVFQLLKNKNTEPSASTTLKPARHIGLDQRTLVEQVDGVFKGQHKRASKARDAYARAQDIKAVEFQKDGQLCKQIVFPELSIGFFSNRLAFGFDKKAGPTFEYPAKGGYIVHAWDPLRLEVGGGRPDAIKDPSIFKKISPTLFDELDIEACHIDLMIDDPSVKTAQDANIVEILNDCAEWTKLEILKIKSLTLNHDTCVSLNHLQHLKVLLVDAASGDLALLGRQTFMRRLQAFLISHCAASKLLEGLGNSSELTFVSLTEVSDPTESIKKLSSLSRLNTLALKNVNFDDSMIASLSHARSVKELQIVDSSISLDRLKAILSKCHFIKSIILAGSSRACMSENAFNSSKVHCVAKIDGQDLPNDQGKDY